MEPLAGTNLALGKSATFSLEPNYSLCAGGDETDLFDGEFWQPGDTGFWTDKGNGRLAIRPQARCPHLCRSRGCLCD